MRLFSTRITLETRMKRLLALSAAAICMVATGAVSAADVGVSVQISEPGVYGRVDIGRFPQPQLVVAQPVIITRPVLVQQAPPQPVYLWVPPGHRKDWRKHCGEYNACGVPVYFVKDEWYDQHVRPQGEGHGHDQGKGKDKDKGHGKGKGKHGD